MENHLLHRQSPEQLESQPQLDLEFQRILAENGLAPTAEITEEEIFANLVNDVEVTVPEREPEVSSMVKTGLATNEPNGRDFC